MIGYIWAVLVIVQAFTVIQIVPWGAALAITLGILVIYALSSSPRAASTYPAMSKMTWIIVLVVVGIALAVVVGVLGTRNEPSTSSSSSSSKTEAVTQLCTSVKDLSSTLQGLANIDPSTITSTEIQTDITSVENAWNQVQSSAAAVPDAPTGDLTTAWNGLVSAVTAVPSASSVSDAVSSVKTAAEGVVTAAKSTESQLSGCTPS